MDLARILHAFMGLLNRFLSGMKIRARFRRVTACPNGTEGLQLARQEPPDLVLCDVMMPGLDGYAVLAAMRADPRFAALPFLFLTARGDRDDLRSGMNLGADDYLTQPRKPRLDPGAE